MAVTKVEQSEAEKTEEARDVKQRTDDVAENLFKDLGLDDEEEQPEEKKDEEEEEEEQEEADEQEAEDDEEDEVEEEDDTEDVVPVSKMKKRINAEKTKRQVAEAKLAEAEAKLQKQETQSTQRGKLEAMSTSELKDLKVRAKAELRELIRSGDDPDKEVQIDTLIDEIDEVVSSAPTRFKQDQIKSYDEAVREVMDDPDNDKIDFEDDKTVKAIKDIASHLYSKHKDLQTLKTGQATALRMAVEHFREVGLKKSSSKKEERKLKQQNLKLKKKTGLDSETQKKGVFDKEKLKKARVKLIDEPNVLKKTAFVESLLDVDKYLPANQR